MDLRLALYDALVQIIAHAPEDEPEHQPSLALSQQGLSVCRVPPSVCMQSPELYWDLAFSQASDGYLTQRLARTADCESSLLGDFYQRASQLNPSAADQVTIDEVTVLSRLQNRWLEDVQILNALAGADQPFICTLQERERVAFYQLNNPETRRAILWNNLVRFYSDEGIGWIEQAQTLEQQMAQELQAQDADSLIFAFANQAFCLQLHESTGWFVHASNISGFNEANQRLARLKNVSFNLLEVLDEQA